MVSNSACIKLIINISIIVYYFYGLGPFATKMADVHFSNHSAFCSTIHFHKALIDWCSSSFSLKQKHFVVVCRYCGILWFKWILLVQHFSCMWPCCFSVEFRIPLQCFVVENIYTAVPWIIFAFEASCGLSFVTLSCHYHSCSFCAHMFASCIIKVK